MRLRWTLVMGVTVAVVAFALGRLAALAASPLDVLCEAAALGVGIVAGIVHERLSAKRRNASQVSA